MELSEEIFEKTLKKEFTELLSKYGFKFANEWTENGEIGFHFVDKEMSCISIKFEELDEEIAEQYADLFKEEKETGAKELKEQLDKGAFDNLFNKKIEQEEPDDETDGWGEH